MDTSTGSRFVDEAIVSLLASRQLDRTDRCEEASLIEALDDAMKTMDGRQKGSNADLEQNAKRSALKAMRTATIKMKKK